MSFRDLRGLVMRICERVHVHSSNHRGWTSYLFIPFFNFFYYFSSFFLVLLQVWLFWGKPIKRDNCDVKTSTEICFLSCTMWGWSWEESLLLLNWMDGCFGWWHERMRKLERGFLSAQWTYPVLITKGADLTHISTVLPWYFCPVTDN